MTRPSVTAPVTRPSLDTLVTKTASTLTSLKSPLATIHPHCHSTASPSPLSGTGHRHQCTMYSHAAVTWVSHVTSPTATWYQHRPLIGPPWSGMSACPARPRHSAVTSSLPPRLSTTRQPYQTMARSVWRSSRISRASTTRWSTWRWRPAEAIAGGRVA